VYYIDNVGTMNTVSNIRELVSRMGVRVLTCFEVKPRRRRMETTPVSCKAFCLAIHKDEGDLLLDPAKWPLHVTVSDWYFKPAPTTITAAETVDEPVEQSDRQLTTEQRDSVITQTSSVEPLNAQGLQTDTSHRTVAIDKQYGADDVVVSADDGCAVEDMETTIVTQANPSEEVYDIGNTS